MKKVILIFVLFVLCGCGSDLVSEDYLRSKGVREFCNGYTSIKADNGNIDIYKNVDGGNYEKIFTTKEFLNYNLFTDDKYILYNQGINGSEVVVYDLNGKHERNYFNPLERDYNLNKLMGVKDNYIYLKLEDNNDYKILYGKIDTNLTILEIVDYATFPQHYDYLECDAGGLLS